MKNKLTTAIIFSFLSVYVTYLYFSKQLLYFVHPRYEIFTLVAGMVGIVVGIIAIFKTLSKGSKLQFVHLGIVVVFIGLLFVRTKPLASATLTQRISDINLANFSNKKELNLEDLSVDTTLYSMGDWVSLALNPDLVESMNGKAVKMSGFVYLKENRKENEFYMARFVVTCCAVDARPLGFDVVLPNGEASTLKVDEWVEVVGHFEVTNGEAKIVADSLTKIETPSTPYLY